MADGSLNLHQVEERGTETGSRSYRPRSGYDALSWGCSNICLKVLRLSLNTQDLLISEGKLLTLIT